MALDGTEVKEVERQLNSIKTALDEKLGQLERESKKRGEDAVTKDEWKKVNDSLDAFIKKTNDELKKKDDEIDRLHKKMSRPVVASTTVIDAKASALETKANTEFARWVTPEGQKPNMAAAADGRKRYSEVFTKYMRLDKGGLDADEMKTLSVGADPQGGFWVEPAKANYIIDKLHETSDLRSVAQVQTISTRSLVFPIDRQRAASGWVGEQTARAVTANPEIGELEIPVHEIYAQPASTQNLLDDAAVDVEMWLADKVLQEFTLQENTGFVSGNGVKQPKGFTSYTTAATADSSRAFGQLEHTVTGANGAFKTASATVNPADDLLTLIGKFKRQYRPNLRWGMNRLTLMKIRSFKDQDGNYNIYHPVVVPQKGIVEEVFGLAVDEFSDMADYTTTGALGIVLADWKRGYIIVDRQGIRSVRDNLTSKPYVLFYTTKRVGGGCLDSDAIKFIKFST